MLFFFLKRVYLIYRQYNRAMIQIILLDLLRKKSSARYYSLHKVKSFCASFSLFTSVPNTKTEYLFFNKTSGERTCRTVRVLSSYGTRLLIRMVRYPVSHVSTYQLSILFQTHNFRKDIDHHGFSECFLLSKCIYQRI